VEFHSSQDSLKCKAMFLDCKRKLGCNVQNALNSQGL
jgi:hypothetical protein